MASEKLDHDTDCEIIVDSTEEEEHDTFVLPGLSRYWTALFFNSDVLKVDKIKAGTREFNRLLVQNVVYHPVSAVSKMIITGTA